MLIHDISRFLCFVILKAVCQIKAYGRENIPKKGGFILASNHISYLDPPAVGVACPRRLNYMAREDLFSSPRISWLYYRWRAFPVKRNSADLSAIKEAMRRVKSGQGLLLFPEGARQAGGVLGKPEPGVGFLVSKINAPVIPVFIKGTNKAMPKGAKSIRMAKVEVYFGKQISMERSMSYQEIADKIMASIKHIQC